MAKKKIRNSSKCKVGSTLLLTIAPDASGFAASGFSFVSSSSSPENIFAYLKAALHLNGDIFSLFINFLPPDSGIKVKELLVVQLTHRGRPLHQVWDPETLGVVKIEQGPHLPKHHHHHHDIVTYSWPPELLSPLSLLPGQALAQCAPLDLDQLSNIYFFLLNKIICSMTWSLVADILSGLRSMVIWHQLKIWLSQENKKMH